MSAVLIVAIVFGSIIALIALICGTILMIIKLRRTGGLPGNERNNRRDEALMIQEIYRGLARMEERIDALETILMERQSKYGEKNE